MNPIEGIVTVVWTAPDTLWKSAVSIGTTYPADGSPTQPYMNLTAFVESGGSATLQISFTQDGFLLPEGSYESTIGGTAIRAGSIEASATAGGQLVSELGPFSNGAFAATETRVLSTATPYSITLQAVITHTDAGITSFDYEVQATAVPEPATIALLGLGAVGAVVRRRGVR